jgi:hypothetical protein
LPRVLRQIYATLNRFSIHTLFCHSRKRVKVKLVTFRDMDGMHVGALSGGNVIPLDEIAPDMLALIDECAEGVKRAAQVA